VCFSIHRLTAAADFGSLECMPPIVRGCGSNDGPAWGGLHILGLLLAGPFKEFAQPRT
jgi:hypothetical protein